jgi:hypothetical protein
LGNEELCELLMEEQPLGTRGSNYMASRRIDPAEVRTSTSNAPGEKQHAAE